MGQRYGRQTWLAGVAVCCLLAHSAPRGQTPTTPSIPTVTYAVVPEYPRIALLGRLSGSVELDVVTDGERVTKINIVKPNPLLGLTAQREVATWIFAPHRPTSFRMTVNFEIDKSEVEFVDVASCVTREMPEKVVTHDLPTRVQVIGHPDLICDKVEPVKKVVAASALAGQVVCDCPARSPVPDATVSYYLNPTPAELKRGYSTPFQGHVKVDANGRFQIDDVPQGTYALEVGSVTFNSRGYEVTVVRDGKTRPPLSLAIVPNLAVAEYLRLHPRQTAWIDTRQIPTYPLEAQRAGVEALSSLALCRGPYPLQ